MRTKTRIITLGLGVTILGAGILNPAVLADSKTKLAHLVMEHDMKIAALEESIKDLGTGKQEAAVSEEMLAALYEEVEIILPRYTEFWNDKIQDMDKINVTNFNVIDSNGEVKVQIYIEGDYGWKQDESGMFEPGRFLAYNFINTFNVTAEIYGVDVIYEFYQDGERVSPNDLIPE